MSSNLHYEDYPYPDPMSYYDKAPLRKFKTDNAPRKNNWDFWFPNEPYVDKQVLVVGCGTTEAIIIAAQEPILSVIGIDSSALTIELAKVLAKKEGVGNVQFINSSLEDFRHEEFDAIICSGVLHHIEDVDKFVSKLRALSKNGSVISVMVYGNQVRKHIPEFCEVLKVLGLRPNKKGIEFVRNLIESLPDGHPIKDFYRATNNIDAQIVDTWLHHYFKQYSASELITLMERHSFVFKGWVNEAPFSTDGFEASEEAFLSLPKYKRYDVYQVLNFVDSKITGAFKAV